MAKTNEAKQIEGKKVNIKFIESKKHVFNKDQKDAAIKYISNLKKIPSESKIAEFLRNRFFSIEITSKENSILFTMKLDKTR